MKAKGKKLVSSFLVISLVLLSGNLYAKERRGAKLIIQRIGNQVRQVKKTRLEGTPWETSVITGIRGELIAVKQDSLLLLDAEGKDVSVNIADIRIIRIVRKSKFLQSLGIGLLIGAGTGAILGFAKGETTGLLGTFTAGENALIWGILLGSGGLFLGGIAGLTSGKDKTIRIEGMTDSEIQEAMDKLRKKARIRDYK